jgi:hypothetical protein
MGRRLRILAATAVNLVEKTSINEKCLHLIWPILDYCCKNLHLGSIGIDTRLF